MQIVEKQSENVHVPRMHLRLHVLSFSPLQGRMAFGSGSDGCVWLHPILIVERQKSVATRVSHAYVRATRWKT